MPWPQLLHRRQVAHSSPLDHCLLRPCSGCLWHQRLLLCRDDRHCRRGILPPENLIVDFSIFFLLQTAAGITEAAVLNTVSRYTIFSASAKGSPDKQPRQGDNEGQASLGSSVSGSTQSTRNWFSRKAVQKELFLGCTSAHQVCLGDGVVFTGWWLVRPYLRIDTLSWPLPYSAMVKLVPVAE